MKLGRIAVLGGGPGGLYTARLLKLANPASEVDVYERGEADKTFGFGVGLAAQTRRNLDAADKETFDDILRVSYPHDMSLQVGNATVRLHNENLLAIARTELLHVLQRHAVEAGVRLHFGSRVLASDLDADLIVAADGASSVTREAYADAFGVHIEIGRALYLWCGTEFALPSAVFAPASTEHGVFVTHAYPYAPDRSTFLIETDEETWKKAGFDRTPISAEGNDEVSLAFLSKAFAEQLAGHRLVGNRTRWLRFRTIRCERWHHRNILLLGDAAHTAHYSIGSGTKLAMEDAIALRQALEEASTLEEALVAYEAKRRTPVEHLQSIARRSQDWWDSFPSRLDLHIDRLFVAYMTRTGKVPVERFAVKNLDLVRSALTAYAGAPPPALEDGALVDWMLEGHVASSDDDAERVECAFSGAWGKEADVLIARLAGVRRVWLHGPADRERVLDRFELAERIKRSTGAVVIVEAPAELRSDLAAALVSARADLVAMTVTR